MSVEDPPQLHGAPTNKLVEEEKDACSFLKSSCPLEQVCPLLLLPLDIALQFLHPSNADSCLKLSGASRPSSSDCAVPLIPTVLNLYLLALSSCWLSGVQTSIVDFPSPHPVSLPYKSLNITHVFSVNSVPLENPK